jgi:biopolymer transport protein ExbB/TolQ
MDGSDTSFAEQFPMVSIAPEQQRVAGDWLAGVIGAALAGGFYLIVELVQWGPLQRYFLGHPVAIAATVLFWGALAVLITKLWNLSAQWNRLESIRDQDLIPSGGQTSPADQWLASRDAGYVARCWHAEIRSLPALTRASRLVHRLEELLTRQSQRGTTKHLADDLRELSSRDLDASHDSFGLVRIIVWAIPMLGFLGTVIGITQTLGGLDFTDGAAAVERLKSGLYVAFDTTALGLVLSVLAIFIQFPIERSEQRLMAEIDSRVGHLVSAHLPSDEASDNQTALIADLCGGIRAAVAESLSNQAQLWRETIDEAQQQWQRMHDASANKIADAFQITLVPALNNHVSALTASAESAGDRLQSQWHRWQETMELSTRALASHHETMIRQCQQMSDTNEQTEAILTLQSALDSNLARLTTTSEKTQQVVEMFGHDGLTEAMIVLARAVDVLAERLPNQPSQARRAA